LEHPSNTVQRFLPLDAMSTLSSLLGIPSPPKGLSLGEYFGQSISQSAVKSLLDCLYSSPSPAIFSPDTTRPSLSHDELRHFVSGFALPRSPTRSPLGRNDRVMTVLPAGPESALALLALSCYHSCAPVNASCTISELKEDALRLNVQVIVATKDAASRLALHLVKEELQCEIIYLEARSSGPAGLFDLSIPDLMTPVIPSHPSDPQGLDDTTLILHTSGTSGKKKVVRYSLRTLIVGACCVVHSWDLKPSDINCM
jgi:acyl-coenzyme A synthetase/AMP-(fatty) acid ligase